MASLLSLLASSLGVAEVDLPDDQEEDEFLDNILTMLGEPCLDQVLPLSHSWIVILC